jgi:hypothetical protein
MDEGPAKSPEVRTHDPWKARRVWAIRFVAAFYLLGVWLEGVGWGAPLRAVVPHWIGFFTQVAALFPRAAHYAIDYRAEGYVCDTGEWHELDTRPYFPIDVDDKESRFQRVMFFYRRQKTVMNALDHFLVDVHDRTPKEDGIPADQKIGGVRLMSIRGPIPEIGAPLVRVHYVPLVEIPEKERRVWFQTKSARITERCFGKHPKSASPDGHEKGESKKGDHGSDDEPSPSDEPVMSADPSNDPHPREESP